MSTIVAGVMSGTSADGINVALIKVPSGSERALRPSLHSNKSPGFTLLAHEEFPFPAPVRRTILEMMNAELARVADLARLVAFGAGKPPFSGSVPHALKLSFCEHLSGIGTDKCDAEAEPGATLSLRGDPVPRPAGTEVRARIVPASTPENSIGRCGWPPGIDAARKSWCVAVAAPLPDVAEHVVHPQALPR